MGENASNIMHQEKHKLDQRKYREVRNEIMQEKERRERSKEMKEGEGSCAKW